MVHKPHPNHVDIPYTPHPTPKKYKILPLNEAEEGLVVEIRGRVTYLIIALKVVEVKPEGELPAQKLPLKVRFGGEIKDIITNELGKVEQVVEFSNSTDSIIVSIPGSIEKFRKTKANGLVFQRNDAWEENERKERIQKEIEQLEQKKVALEIELGAAETAADLAVSAYKMFAEVGLPKLMETCRARFVVVAKRLVQTWDNTFPGENATQKSLRYAREAIRKAENAEISKRNFRDKDNLPAVITHCCDEGFLITDLREDAETWKQVEHLFKPLLKVSVVANTLMSQQRKSHNEMKAAKSEYEKRKKEIEEQLREIKKKLKDLGSNT